MASGNLKKFTIIVTTDQNKGISKGGKCPWSGNEDSETFRKLTMGRGKNAVIFGRVTFEKMLNEKPLSKRDTIVISKTWKQENHPGILVCRTMKDALHLCFNNRYEEVFVGGGDSIFREVTTRWMHLCDHIYWTQFKMDFKCNNFFPEDILEKMPRAQEPSKTNSMTKHHLRPNVNHREVDFLELLGRLITQGGSLSEKHLYGVTFEFLLSDTFPILTTNLVDAKSIFSLFLMALKGQTDVEVIRDLEVGGLYTSLKEITSATSQQQLDTGLEEGDLGPWWGWLTRHYRVLYEGKDIPSKGTDQLFECLRSIKDTRRGRMVLFDPRQDRYSLVENRYSTMEFIASPDRAYLDLVVHVSNMEVIEDAKIDIALFGLYLVVFSLFIGCKPRFLRFMVTDFWARRAEPVEKQLMRTPLPFPVLSVRNSSGVRTPDDIDMDSWILKFHESWSLISPMREDIIPLAKK